MWTRSKKVVGLGIGIGTSWFAINRYGTVEAGEKPPYPPQPHCIGKECPRTKWDDDWDKKKGVEAMRRTLIIVASGQATTDQASGKNKNASKPQKVTNKGKNVQVKELPSDPRRFVKPKEVANVDGSCNDESNSGASAVGGNVGDEGTGGLSPLGVSQINKFMDFFQEEFWGTRLKTLIHGTDPQTTASAKIIEKRSEKVRSFADMETSMLDPLTPPLPGQEPDENPHPGELARLEAAFRKYFYRLADDEQQPNEMEIIVCPPELVGYFVCRLLQIPPDRFTSWGIANGSFTELVIYRNGLLGVHRVGDIGFMPPKDVTYE